MLTREQLHNRAEAVMNMITPSPQVLDTAAAGHIPTPYSNYCQAPHLYLLHPSPYYAVDDIIPA